MTNTKKPVVEIRDGLVKAVIWGNPSEHGTRYSVDLVRSCKDASDQWQITSYLSNGETLKGQRWIARRMPKSDNSL